MGFWLDGLSQRCGESDFFDSLLLLLVLTDRVAECDSCVSHGLMDGGESSFTHCHGLVTHGHHHLVVVEAGQVVVGVGLDIPTAAVPSSLQLHVVDCDGVRA